MTTYTTIHQISKIKMKEKTISKAKSHAGQEYQVKDISLFNDKGDKIYEITVFSDFNDEIIIEGSI